MKNWLIVVFIFAEYSFGATILTGGAFEFSYPYVIKIDVDKIIEPDSSLVKDISLMGMGGVHLGVLGAGIHAGSFLYKHEQFSKKAITLDVSCSYLWSSLHSDLRSFGCMNKHTLADLLE